MPDTIIFDLDGTLVDSRQDLADSVQAAFVSLGEPAPDREAVIASVGHGARHLIRVLLPQAAGDEAWLDRVIAAFRAHYLAHLLDHTHPFEGVPEVLAQLAARVPLAVLTNKPGQMARRLVSGLGLEPHFRFVLGPDDVDALKPDPKGLLTVLERLGARPAQSVYVGDMPVDIEVAHAAGTQAVAVAWGLASAEAVAAAGPDRTIEETPALLTLV